MEEIIALFIPIGVGVVMPVLIVWLTLRSKNKAIDKKAEVLMKAIENGADVDPNLLVDTSGSSKTPKSIKMNLLARLQAGAVLVLIGLAALTVFFTKVSGEWALYTGLACLAVGAGSLISYFVGKKYLAPEIAAEEKKAVDAADGKKASDAAEEVKE